MGRRVTRIVGRATATLGACVCLVGLAACQVDGEAVSSGTEATRPAAGASAAGRPAVVATAWPIEWLARRLAGDLVELRCLLPAGLSGEGFQPTAEQIVELGEADLILAQGAGYEAWMSTASLPQSRVVVTSAGLDLIEIETETHSHGRAGEHSHGGADPYTWGDPALLRAQAEAVREALATIGVPSDRLAAAAAELDTELAALADELRGLGESLEGWRALSAQGHHRYLARALGIDLRTLERQADGSLSSHEARHLEEWLDGAPGALALWDDDPGEMLSLLPTALHHVVLDSPLSGPGKGGGAATYDYAQRFRANLERLARAVGRAEKDPGAGATTTDSD